MKMLKIGVPKEIKDGERRCALTPSGACALSARGIKVLVESGLGSGIGAGDEDYETAGAQIARSAKEVWAGSDVVFKVKEPLDSEFAHLRENQTLFCFLHLAAAPRLAKELLERRTCAIAFETVEDKKGYFPLLAPMSEIAGRLAPQYGAFGLLSGSGGAGVLLSGAIGAPPAKTAVFGAGVVGVNAAQTALNLGAEVWLLDISRPALVRAQRELGGRARLMLMDEASKRQALDGAHLAIGAVLVGGARAPIVASAKDLALMSPGACAIDISIDQGGCFEGAKETSHSKPFAKKGNLIWCAIPNFPGAVAQTSSKALEAATLPKILALANKGTRLALAEDRGLAKGLMVMRGKIANAQAAKSLGFENLWEDLETLLSAPMRGEA